MIKKHKWILLTVSALAIVATLATILVAPQAVSAAPLNAPVAHRGGPGEVDIQADSYLADALGITTDKLKEAQETARIAAIDQALDKGLITQAQADALKKNQRAGWGERFGGRGLSGMLGMFGLNADIDYEALLADALDITVEKLQDAQKTANDARIEQAIKDGKLTQEQADLMKARQALQQYMQEQGFFAKAVQAAVDAGIITQEQADSILSQQNSNMWGFAKHLQIGKGGMRGPGGFGRGGRW